MIEKTIIQNLLKINNKIQNDYFNLIYPILCLNFEIFEDKKYKNIFKEIYKVKTSTKSRPAINDLLLSIENNLNLNLEDYEEFKTELNLLRYEIENNVNSDINYKNLLEQSEIYIKSRLTTLFLIKGADIITKSFKQSDLEKLQSEMKKIVNISTSKKYGRFMRELDRYFLNQANKLSTGIDWFDKFLGGGFPKKSISVGIAAPHSGKSQIKLETAVSMATIGYKVLYVSCEMSEELCYSRIDALITNKTTSEISCENLSYEEYCKVMNDGFNKIKGDIYVVEFPPKKLTADMLEEHIEDLKENKDFDVDIIILDAINICATSDKSVKKSDKASYMECVVCDFKELAQKLDKPIFTSMQINREGKKEIYSGKEINTYTVGDFFMIDGYADFIFGLRSIKVKDNVCYNDIYCQNIVEEDITLNDDLFKKVVKLNTLKTRFGSTSYVDNNIFLGCNTNKSRFYPTVVKDLEGNINISGLTEDEFSNGLHKNDIVDNTTLQITTKKKRFSINNSNIELT